MSSQSQNPTVTSKMPPAKPTQLAQRSEQYLPPILVGHQSPTVQKKVSSFFGSVGGMFEAWVQRSKNPNTQRSYRRSVQNFIEYMLIDWESSSHDLLNTTVADVREWRDEMDNSNQAPATINARVSALSGFFKFMQGIALEARLPIQVPNPAHAQCIDRESRDPVSPTVVMQQKNAHNLMSMPTSDSILDKRDRAIIAVYLYTGVRISTGCRLRIQDINVDPDDSTIAIQEKGRGRSRRTLGTHIHCIEAIQDYLLALGSTEGPLFRARLNARSKKLGTKVISTPSMYRLLMSYLVQLPYALNSEGQCRYTPHSLRATTATLLAEVGVPIDNIQELLGHKDIRVTRGYIKRGNDTTKSASHDVPL